MGRHRQYTYGTSRRGIRPAGAFLCHGGLPVGGFLQRIAEAGICPAPLHPLCSGKAGSGQRPGDNDRHLYRLRQCNKRRHERNGRGRDPDRSPAGGAGERHRGGGLYGEHTTVAGVGAGQPVYYGDVFYPHPHGVRPLFQAISLYGHFPAASGILCRGGHRFYG